MRGDARRISVLVDGETVRATAGEPVLAVARRAGSDVPSLCHVDGLRPYSACRLCLVEVDDGRRRVVTACDFPAVEGLRVVTSGQRLERLRRAVLRLHLARAPASDVIRALARRHGVADAGGLGVDRPEERCILCGLCARVCAEIVGASAVGLAGRGARRRVALPFEEDDASECIGCGACSWVCPTGCIEIEPIAVARLRARWAEERPCRYALLGLAPAALCAHDYECRSCPFDHEMFERAGGRHPAFLLQGGGRRG